MKSTRAHVARTRTPSFTLLHPPSLAPEALEDMAQRLRRLVPSHRDPERFHMEKSDLVQELRRLAAALRRGS